MADDDFSQFEVSQPIRVMSEWVPGERETYDTQYGPDRRHLVSGASAAVSPNLAAGHELHEPFELYRNGKLVGEYSYDDASYYSPGRPTTNSVERYGLPELEGPHTIKWLGKQAGSDFSGYEKGTSDFSQFEVQAPKKDDFNQFEGLESNHPLAKQNGWTLGQSILNIWDTAKMKLAENAHATSQQRVLDNVPDQIVQQQIDTINASPYLSPEDKQRNIAAIQQGQAKEKADAQTEITEKRKQIEDLQGNLKKRNVQPWEQVVGSVIPYMTSGLMGPLGPIQAAQQASAETYGDTLNSSVGRLKELHKDWSDSQVLTQALKAASEASRGGGATGLALGVVDVPAAGPFLSRLVKQIGLGAATMEIANSLAEVQKNMAIKANVDPQQDWLGQLKNIEFHVQNIATGGVFGGLHGLGGELGRPSHVPVEDRVPIAEVPDTTTPEPQPGKPAEKKEEFTPEEIEEKRLILGLHDDTPVNRARATLALRADLKSGVEKPQVSAVRGPQGTVSGQSHFEAKQKYKEKYGEDPGDDVGYLTNKGRFVTGEEAADFYSKKPATQPEAAPEKIKAAAVRQGDIVGVGPTHFEAIEDLNAKGGKLSDEEVDQYYSQGEQTGAEYGFVTNTGRFVSREEAQKIGGITDAFQAGGEGIQEPVTATEPWLSAIANRYVEPRVEAGEIGPVTPGKGTTPEAVLARGLAMKPEQVAQYVSDLMAGKGSVNQVAALRAEEARLSQESWRLSRIAEANPNDPIAQRNAEDAYKYKMDFLNGPMKKLKENWAQTGHGLQKEIEVDLGSFNGLREQWFKDVGKEPSKDVQAKMRETARKVREAQAAEQNAMKTLSDEINKQTARRKLPSPDEVREAILREMNGDRPCGV